MDVRPVKGHRGAGYPTLADYLAPKLKGSTLGRATLAVALAALAALLGGCSSIS